MVEIGKVARCLIVASGCAVLIMGCGRQSDEEIAAEVDAQIALRLQRQEALTAVGKPVVNVTVMVESIAVPQALFTDYLSSHPVEKEADALRREVQLWLKSGRARIAEISVISCQGGKRASAQAVREMILPAKLDSAAGKGVASASEVKTPTVLKTLSVGRRLQVNPVMGNNGMIALSLDFELSSQLSESSGKRIVGEKDSDMEIPDLHRVESKTTVKVKNGSYVLLGTGDLPEEMKSPGMKEPILLLFVRADAF